MIRHATYEMVRSEAEPPRRGRTTKLLVLLLVCLILPQGIALAMDYYVDKNHPAASDANSGTEARPLLTIDRAMAVVQPGDHVYIKGGTSATDPKAIYDRSGKHGLPIVTPGTAANKIIIEAYPDDTVILRGDTSAAGTFGINLRYASYHDIKNLKFTNFRKSGYSVASDGHKTDITIENCEFYDCGVVGESEGSIEIRDVNNFTLRDVYIHNVWSRGVAVVTATNVLWERVRVSDITSGDDSGDAFMANYVTGFVAIECVAEDITASDNDGFDLTVSGVMINCVARNTGKAGIKFWRRSGDSYAEHSVKVVNCIAAYTGEVGFLVASGVQADFYNCLMYHVGDFGIRFQDQSGGAVSGPIHCHVVNCIVDYTHTPSDRYQGIWVQHPALYTVDADHNLYHDAYANGGLNSDTNVASGIPSYFSPSTYIFSQKSGSPCIDAGTAVQDVSDIYATYMNGSQPKDIEGHQRPSGANWDIGPYESAEIAGNAPPVFGVVPDGPPAYTDVNEGETIQLQFNATDPDGHALIFFLDPSGGDIADGMTISRNTGMLTWTPDYNQGGNNQTQSMTYDITIGVTDEYYVEPAAKTTIRIVVHNLNRTPAYSGLGAYTLVAGRLWIHGVIMNDIDLDTLTYSAADAPMGMVFDAAIGTISWTPTAEQVGSHTMQITTSDGFANVTTPITLIVLPAAPYAAPTDEAAIFYVDKANGSDANNGSTAEKAWKTIGRAATMLTAGQMVLIRNGTYYEQVTPKSGISGHPIIYKAYPGEHPILDGSQTGYSRAFYARGRSYLAFDGFTFANYSILFDLQESLGEIAISNCVGDSSNTGQAVTTFTGDNLRIENCVFHNHGDNVIWGGGTNVHMYNVAIDNPLTTPVRMDNAACDNIVIMNSEFSNSPYFTVFLAGGNVLIENTRMHNGKGIALFLRAKRNFLINSSIWNTSLSSGGTGVNLYIDMPSNSMILNSLIMQSAGQGLWLSGGAYAYMRNSIVFNNNLNDIVVSGDASLNEDYNIFGSGFTPVGSHSFNADPLFVDADNCNFSLQEKSPAIDSGVNVGLPYFGAAPDIGAYEYNPDSGTVLYGDVSGDGKISAYDAALTAQAAVGLIALTADQAKAADVSGDGKVSAYDAALIAQYAVGLITEFPVEE